MSCQETRQKLSLYADRELRDDELREVGQHLAQCSSCNRAFAKQGAMDMLLKNHFSPEPPEGFLDSFWPAVSERLDGPGSDGASRGGASGDEEVVVFKTSPAMQILDIPERKPVVSSTPVHVQAAEPSSSPWRWPVALIMSTAIVVVGFLYYQKTRVQQQPLAQVSASAQGEEAPPPEDQLAAASQPAAAGDGGMTVALATGGDGGGGGGAATEPGSEASSDEPTAGASRRGHAARRGGKRGRGKKDEAAKSEAKTEAPTPAPIAAPKAKARPSAGGKSALDNLLDDAIGGPAPAAATPRAKAAPTPGSDLSEQLNMNQIRSAMNKIKGSVQSCYDQYQVEGMAQVKFKISPSGEVAEPSIRGKFRGTETGDCVLKAVKKASFPKFSGKPMTIQSYPFLLQ